MKGFPLELDIGAGVKKREWRGYRTGSRKKFADIFSRLDTIHQRDRQTDGHRATAKTALMHSVTRSSADADNRLDAFSGQSRSTNMVPFHMLHIVSYCAMTLKWGQRSLKVIESGIIR